jgi:DNA segregation ATPase FtsK/SpoIIIE, S-DNA-T family
MLSSKQRRELIGLSLLAIGLFTALSLLPPAVLGGWGPRWFPTGNLMGVLGRLVSGGAYALFGAGTPLLPLLPVIAGGASFGWIERTAAARWSVLLAGLAILVPTAAALLWTGPGVAGAHPFPGQGAGWVGGTLALPLLALLGWLGATLVLIFAGTALLVVTIGLDPARQGAAALGGGLRRLVRRAPPSPEPALAGGGAELLQDGAPEADVPAPPAVVEPVEAPPTRRRKQARAEAELLPDTGDPTSADLPGVDLLSPAPPRDVTLGERELDRLGQILIDTLRTFKVESQIVGRTTGPVVTQFEVVPAPGIKVNRIAVLDADLALALRAASVRIVAPIPGKGAVGVEVPNPEPAVVSLREILDSAVFQRARGQLPLGLGKDLAGRPYVADLAKMPHLLIAGATGSGKSVCINTLITSLVYKYSPQELRLLMVDPKMVELSMYSDLPHLRHPVVTDPKDAATVLKWAVLEMERRYALLSENGARSLSEFNRRVSEGQLLRRAEPVGDELDPDRWIYTDGPLPLIVVVVDELADLMLSVQAEIERPLAQLAQKARAIGIHLIVATQRPSVNVITGLIKANFPCRIAFRVSSKVDSRTILDQNGADALLGNGDMLFLPPGHSDPVRIQGAFLSTADTERLMEWYRGRAEHRPAAEEDILQVVRSREAEEGGEELDGPPEERDPLFRQAAEVCIQFQQGSTSLLQRRLRIGYGRAARVIDQLHHAGVLGPPDGSRPREVLVGMESLGAFDED